jgi:hypothetical protein
MGLPAADNWKQTLTIGQVKQPIPGPLWITVELFWRIFLTIIECMMLFVRDIMEQEEELLESGDWW